MKERILKILVLLYLLAVGLSCGTAEKRTDQGLTDTFRASQRDEGMPQSQVPETVSSQPPAAGLNSLLTTQAWEAYNSGDYKAALESADKCINEFLGRAMREQEELAAKKTPLPPTGAVSSQEKQAIFARGLLNDVATCLYVKGRSLEAEGRKAEAMKVYKQTAKYTYARCWDPQGWFWSLAEGALDRLRILE